MPHSDGTFEVKLTPQKPDNKEAESANIGRMSIDKQFHGDLEATSKGEMLASGTMTRGEPQLSVTVVPDSGTSDLAGLAGALTIRIAGKQHFCELDYTVPEIP